MLVATRAVPVRRRVVKGTFLPEQVDVQVTSLNIVFNRQTQSCIANTTLSALSCIIIVPECKGSEAFFFVLNDFGLRSSGIKKCRTSSLPHLLHSHPRIFFLISITVQSSWHDVPSIYCLSYRGPCSIFVAKHQPHIFLWHAISVHILNLLSSSLLFSLPASLPTNSPSPHIHSSRDVSIQ